MTSPAGLAASAGDTDSAPPSDTGGEDVADRYVPVTALIAAAAATRPLSPAIRDAAGNELCYADLLARADAIAGRLLALGVGRGQPIALAAERGAGSIAGLLGILRARGIAMPLDIAQPQARLVTLIQESQPVAAVADAAGRAALPELALTDVALDDSRAPAAAAIADPGPDEPAYLLYTSGSTGTPKGVAMAHGPLSSLVRWQMASSGAHGRGRTLQFTPLTFDVAFQEILSTLAAGGCLVLIDETARRDPRQLLPALRAHAVTRLFLPFAALQLLAEAADPTPDLPALREVITAGEALRATPSLRRLFRALPDCRLWNHYGPTETHVATAWLLPPEPDAWPDLPPIGRPIRDARVRILDDAGQAVPTGAAGEVWIAGDVLAQGYWRRPDLTQERFKTRDGERLYRTGDRARQDADGSIAFLGRIDDQVKIRGYRVEPGEVEATLSVVPGIHAVAVAAFTDAGGYLQLVAHVVAPGLDALGIRAAAARHLPEYMVPGQVVLWEALPLSPNGKLDRRALPAPHNPEAGARYSAPQSARETLLCQAFGDLTGAAHVGADENFFGLGGHSLLALRLIADLRQRHGFDLPLHAIFARPTPRALAPALIPLCQDLTPPIRPGEGRQGDEITLSFGQVRLWMLDRIEGASSAYNIPLAMRLDGVVDTDALAAGLGDIVARHAPLRTAIRECDGAVRGQLLPPPEPGALLTRDDLSALEAPERTSAMQARLAAEIARPFDLGRDRLLRGHLLRLRHDAHVLLLVVHHAAADGASLPVLRRDLAIACAARHAGRTPDFEPLAISYADHAAWTRRWLDSSGELTRQTAYWAARMGGAPAVLGLPTDLPRQPGPPRPAAATALSLACAQVAPLEALARTHGTTLFAVLLAAYAAVLSRVARQDEIVIGTPVIGRAQPELDPLVGFFANTLPLRVSLVGAPDAPALIRRARDCLLDALTHQDVPFERILEVAGIARAPGHAPLFQAMLVWEPWDPVGDIGLPGVGVSPLPVHPARAKFDLILSLGSTGEGGIEGWLEYDAGLFDAATIDRWLGFLQRTLDAFVTTPQCRVGTQDLLTAAERIQVIDGFNAARRDVPRLTLPALFEAQVRRSGSDTALLFGESQVSYADLDARANRFARHLVRQGIGTDSCVALALPRSIEMVVALLGVLKSGAAYMPLTPDDPPARLAFMLTDGRAARLVTTGDILARLAAHTAALPPAILVDEPDLHRHLALLPGDRLGDSERAGTLTTGNLAYLMYTSGSSALPKAVAATHAGVANLAWRPPYAPLRPGDTVLQLAPYAFDASVFEIWGALLNGARLLIAPPGPIDPPRLAAELDRHDVSVAWLTAGLFAEIAAHHITVLARLKHLLVGGDVVSVDAIERVRSTYPELRLSNGYGPTEATTFACVHPIQTSLPGADIPIGRPIANLRCFVLDECLSPVPVGIAGELYIAGPGLARGYHRRPGLTAERYLACPFGPPGARMYRTGDRARWRADGALDFLGRDDAQVKIRGFRVEPGEIEAALLALPFIAQARVEPRTIAEETRLVAYLVAAPGKTLPSATVLRQALATRLPDYLVPAAYVALPALPLTPNGKLNRSALPTPEPFETGARHHTARTPHEALLCQVFAELTGADQVGINDDFFVLGGHSLLAVRLITRLRQQHGLDLPLRALFDHPTPEALARILDQWHTSTPPKPIAPADRSGPLPLSLQQERLWFLEQFDGYGGAFTDTTLIEIAGALDIGALDVALGRLTDRHEMLRARLYQQDGRLLQRVEPAGRFRLRQERLEDVPLTDQAAYLARLRTVPLDLTAGLFDATLLRFGDDRHVLAIKLHHAAVDGWSLELLSRELTAFHHEAMGGPETPLPPMPLQFVDVAHWQRGLVATDSFGTDVDYWRGMFHALPSPLALPSDHPRPAIPRYAGARLSVSLPAGLVRDLRNLAGTAQTTLFMLLETALAVLLHRYSGAEDLVVGTVVAGRSREEFAGIVGPFFNVLALRHTIDGEESFTTLLDRTRGTILEAFAHQEVPFEIVVQAVAAARSLSLGHQPLFQVLFQLHTEADGSQAFSPSFAGVHATIQTSDSGVARHDLVFDLYEDADGGVTGTLEYDRDLFDRDRMQRMLTHYETLLASILAAPQTPVADLPLLAAPERHTVMVAWNDTVVQYPPDETIVDLFERQVRTTPQAVALAGRAWQISYAELDTRANRLARTLATRGIGSERVVGLAADGSVGFFVGLWAIWKAGGAYLSLDPSLPEARLDFIVSDCAPAALISTSATGGQFARFSRTTPVIQLTAEGVTADADGGGTALDLRPTPTDLCYLLYTSGSTGRPKGVEMAHAGLRNLCAAMADRYPAGTSDRILQFCLPSFVRSLEEYVWAFCSGASLHLYPRDGMLDGADLARFIDDQRITRACLVPGALRVLPARRYAALGQIVVAGEALPPDLVDAWAGHVDLRNEYGATETAGILSASDRCLPGQPITIGRPLANFSVHILDKRLQPVPIGVPGEVHVSGPQVARGYHARPGLTAERFIASPFGEPGARMFRTGDMARWRSDGTIEHLGRVDFQVQVRGMRVELEEVEAVLTGHPQIAQAVVRGREGDAEALVLDAYLIRQQPGAAANPDPVAAPGSAQELESIRSHLRRHLPSYMLPATCTWLDALPKTPSGKIDRRALPEPALAGNPAGRHGSGDFREVLLCQIFAELTGAAQVGPDEDFFALGGSSLSAVRLLARVRDETGMDVPLRLMFLNPTPGALAKALSRGEAPQAPSAPVVALQPVGHGSPFFCVAGLGSSIFYLRHLARAMGQTRPFLALRQAPGDMPEASIEQMAERYANVMLERQPTGPFYLGGHSFGAVVAYEIARQLTQRGHRIAVLAIIDGQWPDWRLRAGNMLPTAYHWFANLPGLLRDEAAAFGPGRLAGQLHRLVRRSLAALLGQRPDVASALDLSRYAPEERQVLRVQFAALLNYKPQSCRLPIELFRARVQAVRHPRDSVALGWEVVADGPVRVHHISGNHLSMTAEPHVHELAAALRATLEHRGGGACTAEFSPAPQEALPPGAPPQPP